jgi:hypothetical protein
MGMFAETAFADYHLSLPFADKGKQSSVFHFCLQETNGKLSFVCYLYAAVSDGKRENGSPGDFPESVCRLLPVQKEVCCYPFLLKKQTEVSCLQTG